MFIFLLFLFCCGIALHLYEKINVSTVAHTHTKNAFYRGYKTPVPLIEAEVLTSDYYIVQEEWDGPTSEFGVDYIFAPYRKTFRKGTQEECKASAEKYFAQRLKDIALRKGMFYEFEKECFIIKLLFAHTEGISVEEHVIQTVNESNIPFHEDFKNGLYRVKKVNYA